MWLNASYDTACIQSAKRSVPAHIPQPDYAEDAIPYGEQESKRAGLIRQLTEDEIKGMRKACRVSLKTGHVTFM